MTRLFLVILLALLALPPGAAGQTPLRAECRKTYVIEPGGARLFANVKFMELPARGKASVASTLEGEALKYGDHNSSYRPIGEVTRKQNCAGYVLTQLFPQVQAGNFNTEEFRRSVVMPFGTRVTGNYAYGDVVVYMRGGEAQHIAMVSGEARSQGAPAIGPPRKPYRGSPLYVPILSKDNNERLYQGMLPIAPAPGYRDDPLVLAHANLDQDPNARVEIWRVDRSKLKIRELSLGECDGGTGDDRGISFQLVMIDRPKPDRKVDNLWTVLDDGTITFTLHSGDSLSTATYTWGSPPPSIPPAGFPIMLKVDVKTGAKSQMATGIEMSGDFDFEVSKDDRKPVTPSVPAHSVSGKPATGQMTVYVRPRKSYPAGQVVKLHVGAFWGAKVTYLYKVQMGGPPA